MPKKVYLNALIIFGTFFMFGCGQAVLSHKLNKLDDTYDDRLQMEVFNIEPIEVGEPYDAQLKATKGTPPYKWEIISGELPAGLDLNDSSGKISGIPEADSNEAIIVKLSDSSGNPNDYVMKSFILKDNDMEEKNEETN